MNIRQAYNIWSQQYDNNDNKNHNCNKYGNEVNISPKNSSVQNNLENQNNQINQNSELKKLIITNN